LDFFDDQIFEGFSQHATTFEEDHHTVASIFPHAILFSPRFRAAVLGV
jgi:hypothetical protein